MGGFGDCELGGAAVPSWRVSAGGREGCGQHRPNRSVEEGPGGGSWPFWLSSIMLISCGGILYNWFRKKGPVATSTKVYIESHVLGDVLSVAVALIITVGLFSFVGIYGALPLFLIFYIRFMGKHTWRLTGILAVAIPVFIFYFFEITLKIILPKGLTEPLFLPLYKIFF